MSAPPHAIRGDEAQPREAPAEPIPGRLRAYLESQADALWIVDVLTLEYVEINDAACRLLGFSRQEQFERTAAGSAATAGLRADSLRAMYADVVRQAPRPYENVTTVQRADGEVVEMSMRRQAFESGGRWYVLLRAASAALRGSARTLQTDLDHFRSLMALNTSAISLVDATTLDYIDVNDAACAMLGYSREALLAKGPATVLGVDKAELVGMADRLVMMAPQPLTLRMVVDHGQGGKVHARGTHYAFRAGERWVIFTSIEDFTRRREAEQALRRLSVAIDRAGDSVSIADAQTCRYVYVNERARERVGLSAEQYLAARPWEIDLRLESEARTRAMYRRLVACSPQVELSETSVRHREGGLLEMEVSRGAVEVDGHWFIVMTGRDISGRKRAQAELQSRVRELARSNRELERFAQVASHDLSEPLKAVAAHTRALADRWGPRLDDEAREFIGFAVDGARRMQRLIDDLLAYAVAGQQPEPARAIDMNRLLDDVLRNLGQLVEEKRAIVERQPLPLVRGDPTALAQLLQNLVGNALKFVAGRAPRVRIGVSEGPLEWTFRVEDNGVGIEPKYFERIFVIFQRLHTQDRFQGTGIGLAICKKIVERHGGRIWVESEPGHGATFLFTLPKFAVAEAKGAA